MISESCVLWDDVRWPLAASSLGLWGELRAAFELPSSLRVRITAEVEARGGWQHELPASTAPIRASPPPQKVPPPFGAARPGLRWPAAVCHGGSSGALSTDCCNMNSAPRRSVAAGGATQRGVVLHHSGKRRQTRRRKANRAAESASLPAHLTGRRSLRCCSRPEGV